MANYDARIILAGQSPDILGSMARGNELAAQTNQLRTQNALSSLFQQQGPGIMAGEQGALNALSRISPDAALGVQDKRLGMDATRQGMRINEERLSLARDEARRSAMEMAAQMSAAEREEAAAETERALAMATQINDAATWDATMRRLGQDQFVGQFDNKDMLIAGAIGVTEALKMGQGPAPQSPEGRVEADRRAGLLPQNYTPPPDPKDIDSFRKEFAGLPAVKGFSEQSQAFGRIVASAENPSPAGDLALIFNYMKVLDPGSVVRESEFQTAADAAAWLQRSEELGMNVPLPVAQAIRRVQTGNRLSSEQRMDFVGRAEALYNNAEQQFQRLEGQYAGIAQERNYPRSQALVDFRYGGERPTVPRNAETGVGNWYQGQFNARPPSNRGRDESKRVPSAEEVSKMPLEDLLNLDINAVPPELFDAISKRFSEVGGQ